MSQLEIIQGHSFPGPVGPPKFMTTLRKLVRENLWAEVEQYVKMAEEERARLEKQILNLKYDSKEKDNRLGQLEIEIADLTLRIFELGHIIGEIRAQKRHSENKRAQVTVREIMNRLIARILEEYVGPDFKNEGIFGLNDAMEDAQNSPEKSEKWANICKKYDLDRAKIRAINNLRDRGNRAVHTLRKEDIDFAMDYYEKNTDDGGRLSLKMIEYARKVTT